MSPASIALIAIEVVDVHNSLHARCACYQDGLAIPTVDPYRPAGALAVFPALTWAGRTAFARP